MPDSIKEVYLSLLDRQRSVALSCLEDDDQRDKFTRCHNFLGDIEKLKKIVANGPECVCLNSASNEYQYALSSALIGQYRHAFGSLRLTMELLISGIYFSGHELHLRQWENASRDINWSGLTDCDNGVFSRSFVKAFHPFLDEISQKYGALAIATYRECSEFVHGNPQRIRPLEGEIEFKADILEQWADAVENIKFVAVFLYLIRYVAAADAAARTHLESLATDNLWHEEQVRACFGGE